MPADPRGVTTDDEAQPGNGGDPTASPARPNGGGVGDPATSPPPAASSPEPPTTGTEPGPRGGTPAPAEAPAVDACRRPRPSTRAPTEVVWSRPSRRRRRCSSRRAPHRSANPRCRRRGDASVVGTCRAGRRGTTMRRGTACRVDQRLWSIDPWSVFKVSALFDFCLGLVILVAGTLLYNAGRPVGTIDQFESFVTRMGAYGECVPPRRCPRARFRGGHGEVQRGRGARRRVRPRRRHAVPGGGDVRHDPRGGRVGVQSAAHGAAQPAQRGHRAGSGTRSYASRSHDLRRAQSAAPDASRHAPAGAGPRRPGSPGPPPQG